MKTPFSDQDLKQLKQTVIIKKVALIFKEAALPFVLLKGLSLNKYYPQTTKRYANDIDILINKNDLSRALTLLRANFSDYQEPDNSRVITRTTAYNMPVYIAGEVLEIHWALAPAGKHFIDTAYFLSSAEEFYLDGQLIPILNSTNLLCALCIHAAKSYLVDLEEKHFEDLLFVIKNGDIDWYELNRLLKRANCQTAALAFIQMCQLRHTFSLPDSFIMELSHHRIKSSILNRILQNRGYKEALKTNLRKKQLILGPLLIDSPWQFFISGCKYIKNRLRNKKN